jgi:hypothetical protein
MAGVFSIAPLDPSTLFPLPASLRDGHPLRWAESDLKQKINHNSSKLRNLEAYFNEKADKMLYSASDSIHSSISRKKKNEDNRIHSKGMEKEFPYQMLYFISNSSSSIVSRENVIGKGKTHFHKMESILHHPDSSLQTATGKNSRKNLVCGRCMATLLCYASMDSSTQFSLPAPLQDGHTVWSKEGSILEKGRGNSNQFRKLEGYGNSNKNLYSTLQFTQNTSHSILSEKEIHEESRQHSNWMANYSFYQTLYFVSNSISSIFSRKNYIEKWEKHPNNLAGTRYISSFWYW